MKRVSRAGVLGAAIGVICMSTHVFAASRTLEVWGWPGATDSLVGIGKMFEKANPGVTVKVVSVPYAEMRQKLLVAFAAGKGPDVQSVPIDWVDELKERTALYMDLLPSGAGKYKDKMVAYKWHQAAYKGRLMAMPWDIGPSGYAYRRDLVAAAGYPSQPEQLEALTRSWDDFLMMGQKLTRDTTGKGKKDQFLYSDPIGLFWTYVNQDSLSYLGGNNKFIMDTTDREKWIAAIEFARKFHIGGVCAWNNGTAKAIVFSKLAAWSPFFLTRSEPKNSGKYGMIKIPRDAGVNDGGSFLAIPKTSKSKSLAYKYVEFALCSAERQNWMYDAFQQFPAFIPAWTDAMYNEPDEYFGGQVIRRKFYEIARTIPNVPTTKYDLEAAPLMAAQLNAVLLKSKAAPLALRDAADAIKKLTARLK